MPDNQSPDLLIQILNALPELATFAKEALEAAGAFASGALDPIKRKEAREALLAGYNVIDKLRDLPDWADDQAEQIIDGLLDHAFGTAAA